MRKSRCSGCKSDLALETEDVKFITCMYCHKSNKNPNFKKSATAQRQDIDVYTLDAEANDQMQKSERSDESTQKKKKDRIMAIVGIVVVTVVFLFLRGRGREEISNDLVGTWEWNGDSNWTYTFNDDGTGSRGFDGSLQFEWRISWGNLRLECPVAYFGVYSELWGISIEEDILVLNSLQNGPTLRYYRQD